MEHSCDRIHCRYRYTMETQKQVDTFAFCSDDSRNTLHKARGGLYGIASHLWRSFVWQPQIEITVCYDCNRLHYIDGYENRVSLTLIHSSVFCVHLPRYKNKVKTTKAE